MEVQLHAICICAGMLFNWTFPAASDDPDGWGCVYLLALDVSWLVVSLLAFRKEQKEW